MWQSPVCLSALQHRRHGQGKGEACEGEQRLQQRIPNRQDDRDDSRKGEVFGGSSRAGPDDGRNEPRDCFGAWDEPEPCKGDPCRAVACKGCALRGMAAVNCKTCAHWELRNSPLSKEGFGTCALEKDQFRRARCFSPFAPCNKDSHKPASARVIARREAHIAKARA